MPQVSHSDTGKRSLLHYFAHIAKVKFAPIHLLTILTEHACQNNSSWGADVTATMRLLFLQNQFIFTAISAYHFGINQWRGGSEATGEAARLMAPPPPPPQSCFFCLLVWDAYHVVGTTCNDHRSLRNTFEWSGRYKPPAVPW